MRSIPILLAALGVAGCWASFPDDRYSKRAPEAHLIEPDLPFYEFRPRYDRPGDAAPRKDTRAPDICGRSDFKCTPNGHLGCTADGKGIRKCDPCGFGTLVVDCAPYKCEVGLSRCNGCLVGGTPVCVGSDLVTCTMDGLPNTTTCPKGCKNGACLP